MAKEIRKDRVMFLTITASLLLIFAYTIFKVDIIGTKCDLISAEKQVTNPRSSIINRLRYSLEIQALCLNNYYENSPTFGTVNDMLILRSAELIQNFEMENKTAESFELKQLNKELATNQQKILQLPQPQSLHSFLSSYEITKTINDKLTQNIILISNQSGREFSEVKAGFDKYSNEINENTASRDLASDLIAFLDKQELDNEQNSTLEKAMSAYSLNNYVNSIFYSAEIIRTIT